jgi:hypothetical protein
MSWQTFKNNMIAFSSNPNGISSIAAVAKKYAIEYDACIKRGSVKYLNPIPLSAAPNLVAMENIFKLALQTGVFTKKPYQLVTEMGKGVIVYWTGASLQNLAPSIPAVGSVVNIAGNANYISDVGQWTSIPPTSPTKEHALIIDSFILAAQLHLTTLKGIINTTSLSIALGSPVPGLISWTGYTIEPSDKTTISNINNVVQNVDSALSEEEKQYLKTEIEARDGAKISEKELTPADLEKKSIQAYIELMRAEEETQSKVSSFIDLSQAQMKDLDINAPDECKCTIGTSIVRSARNDVGLVETGVTETVYNPTTKKSSLRYIGGTNMGGQQNPNVNKFKELLTPKDKNGNLIYTPGRIDEMVDGVFGAGTNKSFFIGTGIGLDWCGCAVAAWWKSANQALPPSKGAAWVPSWKPWAEQNGTWIPAGARPPFNSNIKKPKIGSAIIYGPNAKGIHYHIGIVSGIVLLSNNKWTVTTIEGNTGGTLGLLGRGVCCAEKVPNGLVAGFVIPFGCK